MLSIAWRRRLLIAAVFSSALAVLSCVYFLGYDDIASFEIIRVISNLPTASTPQDEPQQCEGPGGLDIARLALAGETDHVIDGRTRPVISPHEQDY
jgi:hypothetical protein